MTHEQTEIEIEKLRLSMISTELAEKMTEDIHALTKIVANMVFRSHLASEFAKFYFRLEYGCIYFVCVLGSGPNAKRFEQNIYGYTFAYKVKLVSDILEKAGFFD